MKQILLLPLLFVLFIETNFAFASDTVSIKNAIDKGMVSVLAKSLGGHSDECLEINIENLAGSDMVLRIEAGRGMISEDTTMQDILITKQYEFLLSKTEKAKLKIFGMCMRAHRGSPSKDNKFSVGKMADTLLVQLARFIDKFNYRNYTTQNAVWVLSDGNPLESIHSGSNDPIAKKLLEFMHILTKKPIPWYTIEYTKDTAILFSQKTHSPGKYDYPFTLNVSKWKKGNYYLKFYADDQVKEKKLIVL